MKKISILAILILSNLLFATKETTALVYSQKDSQILTELKDGKTNSYQINDKAIYFRKGRVDLKIKDFSRQLERDLKKNKSFSFTQRFGKRLLSCFSHQAKNIGRQNQRAHLPKVSKEAFLANVRGGCLFAKEKNDQTYFQFVDLTGLPQMKTSEHVFFAGNSIDLPQKNPHLLLISSERDAFSLLAVKKKGDGENLFNEIKKGFESRGWKEQDFSPSGNLILTQANQTILAREGRNFILVMKQ